uniref:ribbon-helix-helix protein, CopG family n=1 Tax=Pararhizobium sp. IMCC3301 TaxID=3067904 RepID=UPI003532572D
MTKKRVTVTIDPDIDKWLRPEASSTGKSLSNLIRICLREYHELRPERFSTTNKARSEAEDTFKIPPESLAKRPD